MDKRFICLVSCKPYDNFEKIIKGIHELKNQYIDFCSIDALVAVSDVRQLSHEAKKNFPEIRFGAFSIGSNGSSKFSLSVENQIFKDIDAEFVIVGDLEKTNADREELLTIKKKVKSSVKSGLPVLLRVFASESDSKNGFEDLLKESLQDLSEDERSRVSIVCHIDSSPLKLMNVDDLQTAVQNCRGILKEIGGEEYAKNVKILLLVPKYAPKWWDICLQNPFDGVCINSNILPKHFNPVAAVEKKSVQQELPQKEIFIEEREVENQEENSEVKELIVENKPLEDLFYRGKRKSICFVYCHAFDDLEKLIKRSHEFIAEAQDLIDIECLFALPFGSLEQKPNLEGLNWGIWGHSMGLGRLGDRVFLDLFKDQGASFIVIGDRLSRDVLKESAQGASQKISQSLKQGICPIVGMASTRDLSFQIQESFQGLSPEDLSRIAIVLYIGSYGQDIEQEAEQIDKQANFLRKIIEGNFGKEAAENVKILLEISHFSRDPLSYMMLKAVDGISISASVLKAEFLVNRRTLIETASTPDKPAAAHVKELEKSLPSSKDKASIRKELKREEQAPAHEEEVSSVEEMPVMDKVQEENGKKNGLLSDGEEGKSIEQHLETDIQTRQLESEYAQPEGGSEREVKERQLQENTQIEEKASLPQTPDEGINRVKLTVEECAEKLAENCFQQTYLPSEADLESPELKLKRMKLEFKRKFEEFQDRCKRGWKVLFQAMEVNQEAKRKEIIQALNLPIEKIMEFTDLKKVSEAFNQQNQKNWYQVIGLAKEQMDVLYETARYLFENKKYTDAADAFFTLVSMNVNDYRYWFGYGMAKKLEKTDLDSALDSFSMANSLNPAAPEPFIHAAECYIEQGSFSEAKRCLTYGEKLLAEGDEYAYLKKWAKRLTEKIGGKK